MQDTPTKAKTATRHYHWLDLMRICSALMVLIHHYRAHLFEPYSSMESMSMATKALFAVTRFSHEAVMIFFVLSGFLVAGIGISRIREGTFNLSKYIVDRTVRISLPLVTCLLFYVFSCIFITEKSVGWGNLFLNLISLQGIFAAPVVVPLWSLAYEVWFYALFGGIYYLTMHHVQVWRYVIAGIFVIFGLWIFTQFDVTYLFIWLIGAFAYQNLPSKPNLSYSAAGIVAAIIFAILLQLTDGSEYQGIASMADYRSMIEMLFAASIAMIIRQCSCLEPRYKIWRCLDHWGTIGARFSYTLYLSHMIVYECLMALGFTIYSEVDTVSITQWIGAIVIALVMAWILYLIGEKHTRATKQLLFRQLKIR